MRRILAAAIILVVLSSVVFVVWKNGWFASSPTAIVRYALLQANAGNYEAATEYLPAGQRTELLEDPKAMKATWDWITRNRTIASIDVNREDRGITGTFGDIDLKITYKDGSSWSGQTKIGFNYGQWTFGAYELLDDAFFVQNPGHAVEESQKWNITLPDKQSRVGQFPVLLRIPDELIWDPDNQAYSHPNHNIMIQPRLGSSFESLERYLAQQWTLPSCALEGREDISQGKFKAVLFEGVLQTNDKGRGLRCMDLVIGDDHEGTWITATFPNLKHIRGRMRECLTSVRWEPPSGQ